MTTTRRDQRLVAGGGAVLNEDQAAWRTCCYCPLSFGRLDPVQASAGVEGVMFLAAHRSCLDGDRSAPGGPSAGGPRTEGCVAAPGRPERTRDD
jgi:hypothetical protein